MPITINDGGVLRQLTKITTNDNGVLREYDNISDRLGGTAVRRIFTAFTLPSLNFAWDNRGTESDKNLATSTVTKSGVKGIKHIAKHTTSELASDFTTIAVSSGSFTLKQDAQYSAQLNMEYPSSIQPNGQAFATITLYEVDDAGNRTVHSTVTDNDISGVYYHVACSQSFTLPAGTYEIITQCLYMGAQGASPTVGVFELSAAFGKSADDITGLNS